MIKYKLLSNKQNLMNMQKCALLDKEKELRQSHIVPKLFYTYLKKDAGNNPFYSVYGMHLDGYKVQLLCQEAETLLSKYETYFSNKIFRSIVNEKNTEVAYDSHLLIFVVSLIWRCAIDYKNTVENNEDFSSKTLEFLDPILDNWKRYIIGESNCLNESFYIFPITEEWLDKNGIPPIYHRTFLCDIGWNFYIDKGTVAFYVVTPHFLFVSVLFSEDDNYLFSDISNIQETGCVNTNTRMTPDLLKMLNYLGNKDIQAIGKVFKNKKKIQEKLDQNPDYAKSETCRIFKKASLWK